MPATVAAIGGAPVNLFRVFRDVVTFLAGLAFAGYEVLTAVGEPSLIVLGLAATMMGLPATLGVDRLLNRGDTPPPAPAEETTPDPPQRRRHSR